MKMDFAFLTVAEIIYFLHVQRVHKNKAKA